MTTEMTSTEFARMYGQRARQLTWLFGAGSSASAGIPTGWDMIVDFKTRMYCAANNLQRNEVDPSDPIWLERITAYFDGANGMPPDGDPSEYSAAFSAMHPEQADRRTYIETAVHKGTPSFGHRVLASLITSGLVRCIFTTNFDPLIENATVSTDALVESDRRAHLVVGALDSIDRALRAVAEETWPVFIKLHGDYQSVDLKNTSDELLAQDAQLREALVDTTTRAGLVVAGYSGRDDSVMDALEDAVARPDAMPAGLWWVTRPGGRLLPRVNQLLSAADELGVSTSVVRSENFDELMGDIEREVEFDTALRSHIDNVRPNPIVQLVPLPTIEGASFPILRCSALEVLSLPTVATEISLPEPISMADARLAVRNADVRLTVASRGASVIAFGADSDIERVFGPLGGKITGPVPLNPTENTVDRGFIYDALVRAIARERPARAALRQRGHSVILRPPHPSRTDGQVKIEKVRLAELSKAYKTPLVGTVPKLERDFAEAIRVRLEEWDGRWWFVFDPYTMVDLPRRDEVAPSREAMSFEQAKVIAGDWRRERWARRYNPWWNDVIGAWATFLAPERPTTLLAHGLNIPGIRGEFVVHPATAWARSSRHDSTWADQ